MQRPNKPYDNPYIQNFIKAGCYKNLRPAFISEEIELVFIGLQGKKPYKNIRFPMQRTSENTGFNHTIPLARLSTIMYASMVTRIATSLLEHYCALIQLRNNFSTMQTGDLIPLKSNKSVVYAAIHMDENGTFLILANLSEEAFTKYNIALMDAGLAESTYSVETVFGAGQANGPEGSGEAFPEYKLFENPNPYAMYVLKIQSAATANPT